MKSIIVWLVAAFALTAAAEAQQPEPRSRAPLAEVDDLEPAVDVGAEQPAPTDRPAERSVAMLNPSRLVTEPPPAVARPPPAVIEPPQTSNTRVIDTLDLVEGTDLGVAEHPGNWERPAAVHAPAFGSDFGAAGQAFGCRWGHQLISCIDHGQDFRLGNRLSITPHPPTGAAAASPRNGGERGSSQGQNDKETAAGRQAGTPIN